MLLDPVERAFHAPAALVEHVRVDHRRGNVLVPEELLDRAYVVAGLEQVGREAVPQYVRRDRLRDTGARRRACDRTLHDLLVEVVAAHRAATRVRRARACGKDVLPRPASPGLRI